jgi:hypothetical protein
VNDLSPLARLEQDVVDDSVSLASLLRQVMVIGGRAGSAEARLWAKQELEGYSDDPESVPDYRTFSAQLRIDGQMGFARITQPISPYVLPEAAREGMAGAVSLPWPVREIEATVAAADPAGVIQLSRPHSTDLAVAMTIEQQRMRGTEDVRIDSVYWAVAPSTLVGMLDRIRTRLTEFVSELRAAMPPGEDEPTAEQVTQVIQLVWVTAGDGSPVNIAAPVAQSLGSDAHADATADLAPVVAEPPKSESSGPFKRRRS